VKTWLTGTFRDYEIIAKLLFKKVAARDTWQYAYKLKVFT